MTTRSTRTRSRWIGVVPFLAIVGLFAACGGRGGDGGDSASDTLPPPPTTTIAPGLSTCDLLTEAEVSAALGYDVTIPARFDGKATSTCVYEGADTAAPSVQLDAFFGSTAALTFAGGSPDAKQKLDSLGPNAYFIDAESSSSGRAELHVIVADPGVDIATAPEEEVVFLTIGLGGSDATGQDQLTMLEPLAASVFAQLSDPANEFVPSCCAS